MGITGLLWMWITVVPWIFQGVLIVFTFLISLPRRFWNLFEENLKIRETAIVQPFMPDHLPNIDKPVDRWALNPSDEFYHHFGPTHPHPWRTGGKPPTYARGDNRAEWRNPAYDIQNIWRELMPLHRDYYLFNVGDVVKVRRVEVVENEEYTTDVIGVEFPINARITKRLGTTKRLDIGMWYHPRYEVAIEVRRPQPGGFTATTERFFNVSVYDIATNNDLECFVDRIAEAKGDLRHTEEQKVEEEEFFNPMTQGDLVDD